jgi:hypothetical protein
MLDEAEFGIVSELYFTAVRTIKEKSRHWDPNCRAELHMRQYQPALDAYHNITGSDHEGHPSLLMHHRISIYGPICSACGKPLRTPSASYCAACGADPSTQN